MNNISLGGRGHKGLYKTQEMPGTKHKRIPDSSWNQSALGLAQDTRQPSVNQIISSPYLDHLLLRDVRVVILMTRSVFGDDDYFNGKVFLFYLRANKEYRGPIFQKWTMTFGDTLPDTILKSKSKEEQK